jgi:diadenosine tetraphosphate (Ap4A) HIT family hydrolase
MMNDSETKRHKDFFDSVIAKAAKQYDEMPPAQRERMLFIAARIASAMALNAEANTRDILKQLGEIRNRMAP